MVSASCMFGNHRIIPFEGVAKKFRTETLWGICHSDVYFNSYRGKQFAYELCEPVIDVLGYAPHD